MVVSYSQKGRLINADVNGSYNILRKAIPNAFSTLDRELRSSALEGLIRSKWKRKGRDSTPPTAL